MQTITCEARSLYKHYETSDDVFVDREEYIEWMNDALIRCKKKSVVLHLKGIGGIGKSSLLKHWIKTKEKTIRVDCEHYSEFYDRLNIIAKGAVLHGVNLQRFDVLWQIRQRFVEGVEPVKEEGREWAKDVVMAIPFIGSLASIGSAITAVGSKVTPKLKGKYSTIGKWLEERLGNNHIERLLEILWKEPRHAEFLYLDALLEDINNRKDDVPLLFLLDHFEYVDSEKAQWKYQGKKITQTELWSIFLSSLTNCVGVMAGRKPAVKREDLELEETELTELDRDSCIEMLELQGVTDKDLQEKIVSVSAGNPFVVDAICDMRDEGTIVLDDIECLRADTLEEVRVKTWRRLFKQAQDLLSLVDRAGLLPYFNKRMIEIVAPDMKTDQFNRLLELSFVILRDDGNYVFHDLAEELIIAELGPRVKSLTDEVAQLLEKRAEEEDDLALIGHALSVRAFSSEEDAIVRAKDRINELIMNFEVLDAQKIVDHLKFQSIKGYTEIQLFRSKVLGNLSRIPEAEDAIREAISINEELVKKDPETHLKSQADYLSQLYEILRYTRFDEAKVAIANALEIQRTVARDGTPKQLETLAQILLQYSWSQLSDKSGIAEAKEAIEIYRKIGKTTQVPRAMNILAANLMFKHKYTSVKDVYGEAIRLQRDLFDSDPDNPSSQRTLSVLLNGLAIYELDYGGDWEAVKRLWNEALDIDRTLADKNPEVFLQRLGTMLYNHGIFDLKRYRLDEAEKTLLELLKIGEENVKASKEVYEPNIGNALFILSFVKSASGKTSEAIESVEQSIGIVRKRLAVGASILQLALGLRLNGAAVIHMRNGEYEKAEESLLEAIQLYREYGSLPPIRLGNFAAILNNYGILLWHKDRISEAKNTFEEALEISRERMEIVPEGYKGLHSNVLNNHAIILADHDELKYAEPQFQESLSLLEYLAQRTPVQYKYHLAIVLHNYSYFCWKMDRQEEAYTNLKRAIDIKRELTDEYPKVEIFETSIALSFNNLGVMNGTKKQQMEWEEKYITFEELP